MTPFYTTGSLHKWRDAKTDPPTKEDFNGGKLAYVLGCFEPEVAEKHLSAACKVAKHTDGCFIYPIICSIISDKKVNWHFASGKILPVEPSAWALFQEIQPPPPGSFK